MDSLLAIGVGLVLRLLLDAVTDNDDRVSGVLVGMWEGVVLNHFMRRMPRSFDPYLGFGFRIFVDFLFTQSLSRLALVALWSLVGMLLADVAPNLWRDSGLRRLYRQVRKDVRRVERAVPRIRIKNDLPSVRLFNRSRTVSSSASGSARSDRAAPSRSLAPSPAPAAGPARRTRRSPPGTFPNVSGWSETGTDVSSLRLHVEDIVTHPGPSPSFIPSQELATYGRTDTTTSHTRNTTVRETADTVKITHTRAQTQRNESVVRETVVETATMVAAAAASTSVKSIEDASRHNSQMQRNESIVRETVIQTATTVVAATASTSVEPIEDTSRHNPPAQIHKNESVVRETAIETASAVVAAATSTSVEPIEDAPHRNTQTQGNESIVRETVIQTASTVMAAAASTSVEPIEGPSHYNPPAQPQKNESVVAIETATKVVTTVASTSVENTSHHNPSTIPSDWVDIDHPRGIQANEPVAAFQPDPESTPEPQPPTPSRPASIVVPPPMVDNIPDIPDVDYGHKKSQPPDQVPLPESRAASVIGGVYDQPRSALRGTIRSRVDKATSEIAVDLTSLAPIAVQTTKSQTRVGSKLKRFIDVAPEVPPKEPAREPVSQGPVQSTETPTTTTPAQVDPPASILSQPGEAEARPLLFSTSPREPERTEISKADSILGGAGSSHPAPEGEKDESSSLFDSPLTPPPPFTEFDEGLAAGKSDPMMQDEEPTELSEEQKAAEEKRLTFLSLQVEELESSRVDLRKRLGRTDDPRSSRVKDLESDLEDSENTLNAVTARLKKKKFSEPPLDPKMEVIILTGKSATEIQSLLTSTVLDMLLERDDAGPMTVQFVINRSKLLKSANAKAAKDMVQVFVKRHKFRMECESATPGIIDVTF